MPMNQIANNKIEPKKTELVPEEFKFALYNYFWIVNLLVIIAIFSVGFLFFLMPKYIEISNGAQAKQLNEELESNSKYFQELKAIGKMYEAVNRKDIDRINKIVNYTNEKASLISEFNAITNKYGASVIPEIQVMEPAFSPEALSSNKRSGELWKAKKITKTRLTITNVSYNNLINVIKIMENNLRIMDIVKVDYNPQDNGTAILEVLTYQGH